MAKKTKPNPPAASVEEVLDFCNKVRKAGGAKPLNALLPGVPSDPDACLIAQNLNFECMVMGPNTGATREDRRKVKAAGGKEKIWCMFIRDEKVRDKIAAALDLVAVNFDEGDGFEPPFAVILPQKIGNVAENFDKAWDDFHRDFEDCLSETDGDVEKALDEATPKLKRALRRYVPLFDVSDY